MPCATLVGIIKGYAAVAKSGRPPFPTETMLRIHFLQLWNNYSDLATEEALHDMAVYCWFAGLDSGASRLPGESTILRLRHFLEEFGLAKNTARLQTLFALTNLRMVRKHLLQEMTG